MAHPHVRTATKTFSDNISAVGLTPHGRMTVRKRKRKRIKKLLDDPPVVWLTHTSG